MSFPGGGPNSVSDLCLFKLWVDGAVSCVWDAVVLDALSEVLVVKAVRELGRREAVCLSRRHIGTIAIRRKQIEKVKKTQRLMMSSMHS